MLLYYPSSLPVTASSFPLSFSFSPPPAPPILPNLPFISSPFPFCRDASWFFCLGYCKLFISLLFSIFLQNTTGRGSVLEKEQPWGRLSATLACCLSLCHRCCWKIITLPPRLHPSFHIQLKNSHSSPILPYPGLLVLRSF